MVRAIFDAMQARGLVTSGRAFSRNWLGRAPNYTCSTRFEGCAPAALLHLHRRLLEVGEADLAEQALDLLVSRPSPRAGRAGDDRRGARERG
jgi:hypothetical protein